VLCIILPHRNNLPWLLLPNVQRGIIRVMGGKVMDNALDEKDKLIFIILIDHNKLDTLVGDFVVILLKVEVVPFVSFDLMLITLRQ
jgi:hypothetical protein